MRDREWEQGEASRWHMYRRESGAATKGGGGGGRRGRVPRYVDMQMPFCYLRLGNRPFPFGILVPSSMSWELQEVPAFQEG